jgi:hypothetical protein
MTIIHARKWCRLLPALALAALMFQGEKAQAAFSVSLNGTQVAVDGGLNDTNANADEIAFDVVFDGWRVRFTGRTSFSTAVAGSLQTSELLVERQSPGSPNGLIVDIFESAQLNPTAVGPATLSTTLTRNTIGALGTSGTVVLTSTATDLNGNTAVATTPTLTPNPPAQGSGTPATASFNRQTQQYSLRSVVIINGLGVNDGVAITTDALVTPGQVAPVDVISAPAPAPAVMLLGAIPFLALVRRGRRSS